MVGIRKLDDGEIWILGGKPGTPFSSIPGPKVGYMPQEISLVKEFSALGALYYFGRINGMEDSDIEEKFIFLSNLLQLPPRNRLVKQMSGGQQQRVSFACALVHEPELLILDEPTVGLDPLIRDNIWQFLNLMRTNGTTIVITTHYIEEAKQSDKIGLLRNGKLLSEASPNQLLVKCNCDSLEKAFLMLSQKQNNKEDYQSSAPIEAELQEIPSLPELDQNSNNISNLENFENLEKIQINKDSEKKSYQPRLKRNRKFEALMIKNFHQFIRHPGGILFALIFPIVQVAVFFSAIGGDPTGLKMAVVNQEIGDCNGGINHGKIIYSMNDSTCDYVDLSCRFLHAFSPNITENEFYDDLNSAFDAVKHGKAVGVLFFGKKFSTSLQDRRDNLTSSLIDSSQIDVFLDMANRQIALHVEKKLYEIFFTTYENIMDECKISKKIAQLPVRFETPIFGSIDQKYSTFVAPGFLLTVTFFLATAVSSSVIISDQQEGIWSRSLVQGVKTSEILIAHLLTQLSVILIQVTVTLCISFLQFNLGCKGSMITVIFMIMLMGICGMCYGFLISVCCTSHTVANFITTGSFYPIILLCGCIWPIEGMPTILQWLSMTLPTTIPGLSLRNILDKGYSLDDPQVYQGFLVIFGWTTVLVVFCFFGLRAKSL